MKKSTYGGQLGHNTLAFYISSKGPPMQPPSIIIVGSGGFAREVAAYLRDINVLKPRWAFAGFVSTDPPEPRILEQTGDRWLGNDEDFLAAPCATHYVIALADPLVRSDLARLYDSAGLEPATLIHPTASISPDITVGSGSIVCAMASVTTDVRIGAHVHIDRVVTIGHDSVIEDFVTLHPAGVISGSVHIGTRARIGTNASVLQGLRVGADAVIGAGAVVTRDVIEGTTVMGVPAHPVPHTDGSLK